MTGNSQNLGGGERKREEISQWTKRNVEMAGRWIKDPKMVREVILNHARHTMIDEETLTKEIKIAEDWENRIGSEEVSEIESRMNNATRDIEDDLNSIIKTMAGDMEEVELTRLITENQYRVYLRRINDAIKALNEHRERTDGWMAVDSPILATYNNMLNEIEEMTREAFEEAIERHIFNNEAGIMNLVKKYITKRIGPNLRSRIEECVGEYRREKM